MCTFAGQCTLSTQTHVRDQQIRLGILGVLGVLCFRLLDLLFGPLLCHLLIPCTLVI